MTELLPKHRAPRSLLRLLAVPAVALAHWSAAPARASPAPTVVSLTFDDSNADQYQARAILASHGLKATFYVNSGFLDMPDHLTTAQVLSLQSDGHEIGGHTIDHEDLATLGAHLQIHEVCDDRTMLIAAGFHVTSFAYPFGSFNHDIELVTSSCGYTSGRGIAGTFRDNNCADCAYAETIPPGDPFDLLNPGSVLRETPLADVESWVTAAESHGGGWVQIAFHHLCNGCDEYSMTPADFTAFITWLAARKNMGTVVRTIDHVISGGAPQPQPQPQPMVNPDMSVPPDASVAHLAPYDAAVASDFAIAAQVVPDAGAIATAMPLAAPSLQPTPASGCTVGDPRRSLNIGGGVGFVLLAVAGLVLLRSPGRRRPS